VIVKRNLKPTRTLAYTWKELVFVGAVAVGACVLRIVRGEELAALPFGPLGVLGTALAILLASTATQLDILPRRPAIPRLNSRLWLHSSCAAPTSGLAAWSLMIPA
jgi:hypothetical protein